MFKQCSLHQGGQPRRSGHLQRQSRLCDLEANAGNNGGGVGIKDDCENAPETKQEVEDTEDACREPFDVAGSVNESNQLPEIDRNGDCSLLPLSES